MAAGIAEVSAKRAICAAIADGKIAARLYFVVPPRSIDWQPRRELSAKYTSNIRKEDIPTVLTPSDFDWKESRIRKGGRWKKVRGPSGSFVGQGEVIEAEHYYPDIPYPEFHPRPATPTKRIITYWHRIELSRADVTNVLCGDKDIRQHGAPATENPENPAIEALASHLKTNPQIKRADAEEYCERAGYKLSKRAFFARVWPRARERAGLPPTARPGRKRKSPPPVKVPEPPPDPLDERGASLNSARVAFMITRSMKARLRELGYSDDAIAHMTPEEAHRTLSERA
jgi:hypothetical protein